MKRSATSASAPTPPPPHWSPVSATWVVAVGLVLLASLPHQIPAVGRQVLNTWLGSAVFLAGAAWVTTQSPYLGVALLIFLVGVWTWTRRESKGEPFAMPVLNKERASSPSNRWFSEETLDEEPTHLQRLTEGSILNVDEVEEGAPIWHVEQSLGERPTGIQTRPVDDRASM